MGKTFPRYVALDEYPAEVYNDEVTWLEGVIPQASDEIIVGVGPGVMPVRKPIADYLGATQLNQLTDVADALTPSAGQVLAYDGGLGQWSNATTTLLPAVANIGDRLTLPAGGTVATWIKRGAINLGDYQPVGDGVADDTTAVAAALSDADTLNMPLLVPAGTFKTHTIDYRMQSVIGHSMSHCVFLGFPGEDVFHVNAGIGQFYRQGGRFANITIVTDDSIDAAASFSNRGGVGNAGYASDYPDKLAAAPPSTIDWHYDHLMFTSLSKTIGGKNNSCGIYTQNNHFSQFFADSLHFSYLRYGWRDHYPILNFDPITGSMSRDHPQVSFLHFLRCGYQWTVFNWGFGDVANIMLHGGPSVVDLDCRWAYMHISSVEMVGNAPGVNWVTNSLSYKNEYQAFSVSSNQVVAFNENDSVFSGNVNVPTQALPWLTINGSRNRFLLTQVDAAATNYGYGFVLDLGVGNIVESGERTSTAIFRRSAMTTDGRKARQRDSHSALLGITSPMFISSDDLLINPRNLRQSSGLGTTYDYIQDANADFGVCFRRLGTATVQFDNGHINDIDGFRVGNFLPPTKLRIYVKAKVGTAGTLTWTLSAPAGTNVGTITSPAIGTSYSIISWDADLTGLAAGTICRLQSGNIGGGGAGPLDIAWIMFRPWAQDWPVVSQAISADNGDAAKTLVIGDLETQRWNVPLTAARAVTLPSVRLYSGAKFRIVREAGASGAFNLNVGTGPLKALTAASQWCDVICDGAAWRLVAAGTL